MGKHRFIVVEGDRAWTKVMVVCYFAPTAFRVVECFANCRSRLEATNVMHRKTSKAHLAELDQAFEQSGDWFA